VNDRYLATNLSQTRLLARTHALQAGLTDDKLPTSNWSSPNW
jgi:hypothetical protein